MNIGELQRGLSGLGAWAFVADLLAFAAVLSAAQTGTGPSATTITLAVLALALALFRRWEALPRLHRETAPTGTFLAVRFLVLGAATVVGGKAGPSSVFWVLVGLLAITLSLEPVVRRLASYSAPTIVNLPGIANRPDTRFGYGLLYVANTACIAIAFFAGDGPGWTLAVMTALVVLSVVLHLAAIVDALSGYRARQHHDAALHRALTNLEPSFAIYFDGPPDGTFHIDMWLPYLERIGEPFFVIVRNRRNFDDVRRISNHPIVLRRAREDLDSVVVPSLSTVFYVNVGIRNEHMVWYTHLTHVQLNHGESDKKSSFNPAYKMYDKAFVAGQAAIDRFAANGIDMPERAFAIVGRPQVENVEVATGPISDVDHRVVLYAPTWAGFHDDVSHCSLAVAHDLFSALLERGCTIIFRPHPLSYRSPVLTAQIRRLHLLLGEHARKTGRQHVYGRAAEKDMTIYECFNASHAMISDVSSVIGDYLFSQKPFAMMAMAAAASDFHTRFPVSRAGQIIDAHDGHLNALDEALDELLVTDSIAERRDSLKTYYLGDIPSQHYAQRFVDESRALLRQPHPAPDTDQAMPHID